MSYPSYKDYKESEIDWLSDIPLHWNELKSKLIYREIIELSTTGCEDLLSVSEYHGIKKRTEIMQDGDYISRAESLEGYKKCKRNDLIINIMLAWKCGLGVSNFDGIVSPAYCVFRPINENFINQKYFHYLLRTDLYTGYFKSRSRGIIDSRLRLYPDVFGTIKIIYPPQKEQDIIVAFIDNEANKIDSLIAEQQRLIDLLKEKRQAIISHAVTKGLNPDAPMKESGVEWLGQVPEHWDLKRVKNIASINMGQSPKSDDCNQLGVGVPFLQGCADFGNVSPTPKNYCAVAHKFAHVDDILFSVRAPVGAINTADQLYGIGRGLCSIAPIENNSRRYLFYALHIAKSELFSVATGSTYDAISVEQIEVARCVLPPLEEQVAIAKFLDRETHKIDVLINEAQNAIALLQERRKAIIFAAVTGKIDVRELDKKGQE